MILYYFLERQNHCSNSAEHAIWHMFLPFNDIQSQSVPYYAVVCGKNSMVSVIACLTQCIQFTTMMVVVSRTWFSENLCRDDLLYTSIFYHLEYMIFWKLMQRRRSLYLYIVFYHLETLRSLHIHEKGIVTMTTRITDVICFN